MESHESNLYGSLIKAYPHEGAPDGSASIRGTASDSGAVNKFILIGSSFWQEQI